MSAMATARFPALLSGFCVGRHSANILAGIKEISDTACLMGEAMRLLSTKTAPQEGMIHISSQTQAPEGRRLYLK